MAERDAFGLELAAGIGATPGDGHAKPGSAIADARLIKHFAALREGQPLVGYDCEKEVLYMPIGADLPGLYGRAAVLASGLLPVIDRPNRVLKYQEIPPSLAFSLMDRLES